MYCRNAKPSDESSNRRARPDGRVRSGEHGRAGGGWAERLILALKLKEAQDLRETSVEVPRPACPLAAASGARGSEFSLEFEELAR